MKKIILFFSVFIFAIPGYSKTPVDSAFYGVCQMIKSYSRDNNSLPKSWEEFISSGYLSDRVLEDARKFCDIENRYFFPNLPIIFTEGTTKRRIIIMAKQPGGEGNITAVNNTGGVEEVPGRYLIVETIGLGIESGRFSEKRLQGLFEKSGLDINNYTFDAPPPSKYARRTPEPNSEVEVPADPADASESSARSVENPSTHENKLRSSQSVDRGPASVVNQFSHWWWLVIGTLILVGGFVWLRMRE